MVLYENYEEIELELELYMDLKRRLEKGKENYHFKEN